MTFRVKDTPYRLRRTWWGAWVIERGDRMAVRLGFKPWWAMTTDEALEFVIAMRSEPRQSGAAPRGEE